jgi:uncharacterized RDD family membrane protein YckC
MPYEAPRDPTAVVGRRIGAWVIDGAVIIAPAVALTMGELEYLTEDRLAADGIDIDEFCDALSEQDSTYVCAVVGDRAYFNDSPSALPGLSALGMTLLILVLLQGLTGATIGKAIAGLRTVDEDGQRPGIGKALLRTLLWAVDAAPWCFPLVGLITGLTTTGHRRVGDMAAKTYVVRSADAGSPVAVPGSTAVPAAVATAAYGTAPPTAPPWEPTPTAPPPPPEHQPQWDQARGTYITWDPNRGAWLQWDERTSTWVPIST